MEHGHGRENGAGCLARTPGILSRGAPLHRGGRVALLWIRLINPPPGWHPVTTATSNQLLIEPVWNTAEIGRLRPTASRHLQSDEYIPT